MPLWAPMAPNVLALWVWGRTGASYFSDRLPKVSKETEKLLRLLRKLVISKSLLTGVIFLRTVKKS